MQPITPERETSDDSSNESDDVLSPSIEKDDKAITISKSLASLGINLDLDLHITHEDMLQDKTSTPLDDSFHFCKSYKLNFCFAFVYLQERERERLLLCTSERQY